MVAKFSDDEIEFMYPDNWTVQHDGADRDVQFVTVQSPGSGFWMLQRAARGKSPNVLSAEAMRSLRDEYDEMEVADFDGDLNGIPACGFDIEFYCLDFVVRAQIRGFVWNQRTYVLLYQAEDRDFAEQALVFSAITTSLIQHFQSSAA